MCGVSEKYSVAHKILPQITQIFNDMLFKKSALICGISEINTFSSSKLLTDHTGFTKKSSTPAYRKYFRSPVFPNFIREGLHLFT